MNQQIVKEIFERMPKNFDLEELFIEQVEIGLRESKK
jgi:hypothetical protein